MKQPEMISELAVQALKEFPSGIESALFSHVQELIAEPSAKNLADVRWLLEAMVVRHQIYAPIEPRLEELIERVRTTGSLARKT